MFLKPDAAYPRSRKEREHSSAVGNRKIHIVILITAILTALLSGFLYLMVNLYAGGGNMTLYMPYLAVLTVSLLTALFFAYRAFAPYRIDHSRGFGKEGSFDEIGLEMTGEDSEGKLGIIIEATHVGTWEWNIRTGDVQFDSRFAEMLGYCPEELSPLTVRKWEKMLHPADLGLFREIIDENLSGQREGYEMECRVRHKDGHWIWIHDKGKIMKWDEDGLPLLMFGSQSDVTELKTREYMLHHSEKLSALGRLAGGISHDMNNQLQKIRGLAELGMIFDSTEYYRKSFESIESLSDRASWIVRQLMFFSGNHLYQPEYCNIVEILEDLAELLNHSFENEFYVVLNLPDEELGVMADRALLNNAFFNICFNAKEAMEHGGKLIIEAGTVSMDKRYVTYTGDLDAGSYVKITFTDEGSGIEESQIDRIFEPFFTTKEFGTQGLGLAKVVSAVREHEGGVQVHSVPGEGAEFSVFLPLEIVGNDEPSRIRENFPSGLSSMETILVIDDELMICQLLTDYFELMKLKSRYFTDPRDGVEYFREFQNDIGLVILDMKMPNLTGREVFEQLRKIRSDVRILFLSGYSQSMEQTVENSDNIAGILAKPVRLEDLKKTVETILGERSL